MTQGRIRRGRAREGKGSSDVRELVLGNDAKGWAFSWPLSLLSCNFSNTRSSLLYLTLFI